MLLKLYLRANNELIQLSSVLSTVLLTVILSCQSYQYCKTTMVP